MAAATALDPALSHTEKDRLMPRFYALCNLTSDAGAAAASAACWKGSTCDAIEFVSRRAPAALDSAR
jgi:hypothetical protein